MTHHRQASFEFTAAAQPVPASSDIRPPFAKALHEAQAYHLPAKNRAEMRQDLLNSAQIETSRGSKLGFSVRMNFNFDKSGVVAGGEEVCRTLDKKWARYVKKNPDVIEDAIDRFIEPYVKDALTVLDDPTLRVELVTAGAKDDLLLVDRFGSRDLRNVTSAELPALLDRMNDAELSSFWMAIQVLGQDLCMPERALAVEENLNAARAALQDEWLSMQEQPKDYDVSPEASLVAAYNI